MRDVIDNERFARALHGSHTVSSRIEVWADGTLLTESAPFIDGEVSDEWVTGIRRQLTLSVPPTRQWFKMLENFTLEIRPYRGIIHAPGYRQEVPLGRFPVTPPSMGRPLDKIQFSAQDYYSRVVDADFTEAVMSPTVLVLDLIRWLFLGAGLPEPVVQTGGREIEVQILLERTRHDALVDAARRIQVEAFIDREGMPVIRDAVGITDPVADLLTGKGGTVKKFTYKPDWSKVYNMVTVKSTYKDGPDAPQTASIGNPGHPASPQRMGGSVPKYRVFKYSSKLVDSAAAGFELAEALLAKVSAAATTMEYECIPDPRLDAGDTVLGATMAGPAVAQIQSITTPLRADESQTITTVNTQPDVEDDL